MQTHGGCSEAVRELAPLPNIQKTQTPIEHQLPRRHVPHERTSTRGLRVKIEMRINPPCSKINVKIL